MKEKSAVNSANKTVIKLHAEGTYFSGTFQDLTQLVLEVSFGKHPGNQLNLL
jgi:hypothetical protein